MPEGDSESLIRRMKTTPLRGAEAGVLLKRLLDSMAKGAGDAHMLAARAIFGAAEAAQEPEKSYLLDQLYFCLARALEDYAMLCLMTWDETRHPIDVYLNMDRPELRAFYSRCRKNLLTEEQLFRVAGVAEVETVKKQAAFKVDLFDFEAALEWASRDAREHLSLFGRLYHSTVEDADPLLGPWQIAYAKAPIGLKLVLDSEAGSAELLMGAEEMQDPLNSSQKVFGAFSAEVRLDENFAETILHYLDEICSELRRRAALKLAMRDNQRTMLDIVRKEYLQHLQALGAAKRAQNAAGTAAAPAGGPVASTAPAEAAPAAPAAHAKPTPMAGSLKVFHSYITPFKKPEADEAPPAPAPPAPPAAPAAPGTAGADETASASHDPGEVKQLGGIKIIHSKGYKE